MVVVNGKKAIELVLGLNGVLGGIIICFLMAEK
jgi:hypothetical protein